MTERFDEVPAPRCGAATMEPLWRATHYSGGTGCSAQARAFAEAFLARLRQTWSVALDRVTAGDVLLVVSELITNADRHSPGPCVLELEGTPRQVTVTVYDSGAAVPYRRPRDPARVGGHGLEIVGALAELRVERVPVGKRVSAVLTLPA
ncbi:ATP-binding protein [Streptomyces xanthii]|nr:ATP-binding protein [Streptomyces xanthii]